MSTTLQPAKAADTGDREFVKALGLLSSTTIVMGSMIGSGIFIVSAGWRRPCSCWA